MSIKCTVKHSVTSYCVLLGVTLMMAACQLNEPGSNKSAPGSTVASTDTQHSASSQALAQVFHDYNETRNQLQPILATQLGDKRFNHLLGDTLSDEAQAAFRDLHASSLARLSAIDLNSLNSTERDSYQIFRYQREIALEYYDGGYADIERMLPLNQMFNLPNTVAAMGSGESFQPFLLMEDYDSWLQRAGEFPRWVDQAIANMRKGMQQGVVQPRVVMERVLAQLQAVAAKPTEQSLFFKPINALPAEFSEQDRQRLRVAYSALINEQLSPAYQRLHDFIRDEYLPKCRDSVGLSALPGGEALYRYRLRSITTTALTPPQIHAMGQQEVALWFAEMEKLQQRMAFDGSTREFFEFLRSDPRFYPDSEQALLDSYRWVKEKVDPQLPTLFKTLPKTPYVIKPIEAFRAKSSAAAMYYGPPLDGSRPGIFYVNTYDLKSRPTYLRDALSIHEAAPGHHFQIALAQEQTDLPTFRRSDGNTAFVEGWGLYSESLGEALGLYADDTQYLGYVYMSLWRANRLVVDTGLHAMGWSREQAIEWMTNYSPMTELDVIAEVERYIAIPGQAVAYKVGKRHILMLRERAEQALGEQFDIREFHDQVIGRGALPLHMLEEKIDRWIKSYK